MNFENDIKINKFELDKEWLGQASLLQEYSVACAEAEKDKNKADEQVKIIRSKLVLKASADPKILGKGVKPTGPNVEAFYRTHPSHIKAKEDLHEATYEYDVLKGAVFALNQRKTALENLVRLQLSSYYGEPTVSGSETTEFNEQLQQTKTKDVQDSVRNKLNKKEETDEVDTPRRRRRRG